MKTFSIYSVNPAPLQERTPNLLAAVSLMFAAFVVLAGLIWRHERVAHFRELYQREVDREAQREQAEDALKASEFMFRSLAESVPAAIWITDATGNTTYMNQRFIDATGLSAGQGAWDPSIRKTGPPSAKPRGLAWSATSPTKCCAGFGPPANIDGS